MRYWNRRWRGSLVTISAGMGSPLPVTMTRVAPSMVDDSMPGNQVWMRAGSPITSHTSAGGQAMRTCRRTVPRSGITCRPRGSRMRAAPSRGTSKGSEQRLERADERRRRLRPRKVLVDAQHLVSLERAQDVDDREHTGPFPLHLGGEQATKLPAQVRAAVVELRGDRGMPVRAGTRGPCRGGDRFEQCHARLDDAFDLRRRRRVGSDPAVEQRPGLRQLALDGGAAEIVDVVEVPEQRARRQAGAFGDL